MNIRANCFRLNKKNTWAVARLSAIRRPATSLCIPSAILPTAPVSRSPNLSLIGVPLLSLPLTAQYQRLKLHNLHHQYFQL